MLGKFVNAYFCNREKDRVESLWQDDEDNVRVEYCTTLQDDETYQIILTNMTEDQLHESTAMKIRGDRQLFEDLMMDVIQNDVDIEDLKRNEDQMVDFVVNWVTRDYTDESLFKIKLRLFEHEQVAESTNRSLKAKLRKADNIIDVLVAYSKF